MQGIQSTYDNTKHINIDGAQYQKKKKGCNSYYTKLCGNLISLHV
jgi:hypothetical protein